MYEWAGARGLDVDPIVGKEFWDSRFLISYPMMIMMFVFRWYFI